MKVQAHEERILEASFYETFVAMMLKAVEDPRPEGSPILMMLEEVMTMDRNSLAHTLVRFYLAHGSVLPFLDTLTMKEIHQTCKWLQCIHAACVKEKKREMEGRRERGIGGKEREGERERKRESGTR